MYLLCPVNIGQTIICISNEERNMVLFIGKEYIVTYTRAWRGQFIMRFKEISPEITKNLEPHDPVYVRWLDDYGNERFKLKG